MPHTQMNTYRDHLVIRELSLLLGLACGILSCLELNDTQKEILQSIEKHINEIFHNEGNTNENRC